MERATVYEPDFQRDDSNQKMLFQVLHHHLACIVCADSFAVGTAYAKFMRQPSAFDQLRFNNVARLSLADISTYLLASTPTH